MFAYVKGTVADIAEDNVVVETGGVGYNIRISATTAEVLPGVGQDVKMYTYTLVREDAFQLYGFLTKDDLDIFRQCITVNGIGPKGALAILSVMDANALRFAIMSGDAKAIARAPGIGAKTAERLILDLKDRVSLEDTLISRDMAENRDIIPREGGDAAREAVEALVALGYGQAEASRAVRSVEGAEQMESGALLKAALKKMF